MEQLIVELTVASVVIVFGVIGYLLSSKDNKQDEDRREDNKRNKEIYTELFLQLKTTQSEIIALKVASALSTQSDVNINKMLSGLDAGFDKLGDKIDMMRTEMTTDIKVLGQSLTDHINHEERARQ
jgi:hypothetical protein